MFALPFLLVAAAVPTKGCEELVPDTAQANYRSITQCLLDEQKVVLGPGTFLLPHGVKMPSNTSLAGSTVNGLMVSRLLLAVPSAITHYVLQVSSDSEVTSVVLDGGEMQKDETCCRSVLSLVGNTSLVTDVEVLGSARGIGILVENPTSHDNLVLRAHVHDCYYGVIFAAGLHSHNQNVVQQGLVEDIYCDAVTFAGHGQVRGTVIRRVGYACGAPSFSTGAGFFCRGNRQGGLVQSSHVSDTCGMSLDVDTCSYLDVSQSTFDGSGYDWSGNHTHCWGMPTAALLDSQMCSIRGNQMSNVRASNNISFSGDPHQVYSQVAAQLFSDLPHGNDTIVNFAMLHRPNAGAWPCVSNEVINNSFTCEDCVAYFAGRGTGYAGHSESQPSTFEGNTVLGLSVRCGGNLYAAQEPVCRMGSGWPCNADDYLHPETNFRNDHCSHFAADIYPMSVLPGGLLRNPLPLPSGEVTHKAPTAKPQQSLSAPAAPRWQDTGSTPYGMVFRFG